VKAAVCYEFAKPLVVEEVDIDPPKKDEVKVKMAATAVCHSDIHDIMGELRVDTPFICGHESSGYVDEIGKDITSVKPGDPVVVSLLASCGKCVYCRTGRSHLCNVVWPLDKESRIHSKRGETIPQTVRMGSFAEYAVVHESQVVKIPADMPLDYGIRRGGEQGQSRGSQQLRYHRYRGRRTQCYPGRGYLRSLPGHSR